MTSKRPFDNPSARLGAELRTPLPTIGITGLDDRPTIEAVEAEGHPFVIGIQWHPEELADDDVRAQQIFDALVEACQR